jgi:hypothetical protein
MLIFSHGVIRSVRSLDAGSICTKCGWNTSNDNLCRDNPSLFESLAMGSSTETERRCNDSHPLRVASLSHQPTA